MENKVIAKEYVNKNYVSKNDIKDLQGWIHQILDDNAITRGYQQVIDSYFERIIGG